MNEEYIEKFNNSVFYPLFSNCIASIHGSTDLIARGVVNTMLEYNLNQNQREQFLASCNLNGRFKKGFLLNPSKTPLLGQLQFINSHSTETIEIDIDELSKSIVHGKYNPSDHILQPIRILIVTCYEFTKPFKDKSPIWEFFRHIRNASAHGGKFNFQYNKYEKKQEPIRPAKWRNIELLESLQGKKLLIDKPSEGLLYSGDIINLLLDIEDQYPQIRTIEF